MLCLAHLFASSNMPSPLSMQIWCVFQAPLLLDLILDLQAEIEELSILRMHAYTTHPTNEINRKCDKNNRTKGPNSMRTRVHTDDMLSIFKRFVLFLPSERRFALIRENNFVISLPLLKLE